MLPLVGRVFRPSPKHSVRNFDKMVAQKQDPPLGKAFMITGTDTGVGKTLIACALAAEFHRRGLRVGVMKPVETGVGNAAAFPRASDAARLKQFSASPMPIHVICPYRFRAPLAPWVAARMEHRSIPFNRLCASARSISQSHDVTMIESAGGLLVPLTRGHSYRDLARSLNIPILIVARLGLGTINHTLLTLEAARRAGVRVLGIVLNNADGNVGLAQRRNPDTLRNLAGAPLLGVFPHLPGRPTPHRLAAEARLSLDIHTLMNAI